MNDLKKFNNITDKQIKSYGVQALADRPNVSSQYGVSGLTSAQLKLWFDRLATFLAGRINEIGDALSSNEAAQYIKLPLDDIGIGNLADFLDSIQTGRFAQDLMEVYPSVSSHNRMRLQEVIYETSKSISGLISEQSALEEKIIDSIRMRFDNSSYMLSIDLLNWDGVEIASGRVSLARLVDGVFDVASEQADRAQREADRAEEFAGQAKTSSEESQATLDIMRAYLSQIPKFGTKIVASLPTFDISATTIYLVRESDELFDIYTEYLFIPHDTSEYLKTSYIESEGSWESVGGRAGSVAAPGFDLYILGLPDVPISGDEKAVSIDAADLLESAMGGPIRMSLVVAGSYITIVANAIVRGSSAVVVKDIDPYNTLSVTITASSVTAKITPVEDRFAKIEGELADLLYKAISVTSFTTSTASAEIGSTVNNITLAWKLNKKPVSLTIDGTAQNAVADGSVSMTGLGLTDTKKWTLKATDERGTVATRETSLSFHNGVYYGVGAAQSSYTSAFVRGLTKTLRSNKLASFTANAGAGQYIYYCLPTRMGTCTFTVGGFEGGFDLVSTLNFENASGYKENYYIYRSTNAGLGNTTVGVT
jgi:hypothetical protein